MFQGHERMHTPASQTWPGAQTWLQAPQFDASTSRSLHRPSQSNRPDGQEASQSVEPSGHSCGEQSMPSLSQVVHASARRQTMIRIGFRMHPSFSSLMIAESVGSDPYILHLS
jgi:hypothetical protein